MLTWKRGEWLRLSPHFTSSEFTCDCGRKECVNQMVSPDLIAKLEKVRTAIGPIQVTDGYRCQWLQDDMRRRGYETAAGVSQHTLGNAADVRPQQLNIMPQFEAECAKHFEAIGIAATWLHVDLRTGKERRWYYK